jgi:RNA polymerase primary sigma factor
VFVKFDQWEPHRGALTTWARWQAVGVVREYMRERQQVLPLPVSQSDDIRIVFDEVEAGNEESVDADELAAVHEALAQLSDRDRQAVRLRFGLDDGTTRTLGEVGEIMGVSKQRVGQIVSRGLDQIRAQLASCGRLPAHQRTGGPR